MITYLKPMSLGAESHILTEYLTFGTSADCLIPLIHTDVADRHARIDRTDRGLIVRDLLSKTGTFINETKIKEAEMQEGDVLRIGPFEFQLCVHELNPECKIHSKNPVLEKDLLMINTLAKTNYPVLILGPSGSGKDVIAHEIHRCSPRSDGPFISVNCSTLTETLVESELFGHIKGSFTGAIADRKGAFEAARGGTLFLDEIGDMPFTMQAKLLRALENDEIRPVGSDVPIKTNVRVIAATHQNLYDKIEIGQFRSDLFFRLNVVQVNLPALAHRMEDFEELLMHFARSQRVRFSMPAIYRMKKHAWPGNIRELRNAVARAKALFPQEYIEEDHVDHIIDRPREMYTTDSSATAAQNVAANLPVLKEIERQMIIKRLSANKGNQRRTAQDLGIPKSTLHDRLKYYNIDINRYKV
jgi:DNA-binding NtrC family response regulator